MKLKDLLKQINNSYDIIHILVFEGNGEEYKTPYPKKAIDIYGEREVKSYVFVEEERGKEIIDILKILIY